MKKQFLIIGIMFIIGKAVFGQSGSGTALDPYIITTPAEFDNIRNLGLGDKYYQLGNNIDFSEFGAFTKLVLGWTAKAFHLNGMGYTISNMTIAISPSTDDDAWGMFEVSGNNSSFEVRNINFNES
jgi:hypothetical protein